MTHALTDYNPFPAEGSPTIDECRQWVGANCGDAEARVRQRSKAVPHTLLVALDAAEARAGRLLELACSQVFSHCADQAAAQRIVAAINKMAHEHGVRYG